MDRVAYAERLPGALRHMLFTAFAYQTPPHIFSPAFSNPADEEFWFLRGRVTFTCYRAFLNLVLTFARKTQPLAVADNACGPACYLLWWARYIKRGFGLGAAAGLTLPSRAVAYGSSTRCLYRILDVYRTYRWPTKSFFALTTLSFGRAASGKRRYDVPRELYRCLLPNLHLAPAAFAGWTRLS